MRNVVILYCGTSLVRSLIEKLLELRVRPVLLPNDAPAEMIEQLNPLAIMISGSPEYVNSPLAPRVDTDIYNLGRPILGICYGMQIMAVDLGGQVGRMAKPERQCVPMAFTEQPSVLFRDFAEASAPVWMLHTCKVTQVPEGFSITGGTEDTEIAAMENEEAGLYAIQCHPEHKGKDPSSQAGTAIIWNFLNGVCGHEIN